MKHCRESKTPCPDAASSSWSPATPQTPRAPLPALLDLAQQPPSQAPLQPYSGSTKAVSSGRKQQTEFGAATKTKNLVMPCCCMAFSQLAAKPHVTCAGQKLLPTQLLDCHSSRDNQKLYWVRTSVCWENRGPGRCSGELPPSVILGAVRRFDAEFRVARNEVVCSSNVGEALRISGAFHDLPSCSQLGTFIRLRNLKAIIFRTSTPLDPEVSSLLLLPVPRVAFFCQRLQVPNI